MPVQKQTRAGQRTRFKAFVAIGDYNGHVGLGVKCSKEVATAIRGAIIMAKLSIVPVRRGFWGNKIGKPHTVPCKVTGKCDLSGSDLSPPLVVLGLFPPQFQRNYSRWRVSRIATPRPRVLPVLWATLPRQPTLPLLQPTLT